MDSEEIRIELYKRRHQIQMKDIAIRLDITPSAVSAVIDRRFKSRRIAEAISAALERPVEEVFDDWYGCEQRQAVCG